MRPKQAAVRIVEWRSPYRQETRCRLTPRRRPADDLSLHHRHLHHSPGADAAVDVRLDEVVAAESIEWQADLVGELDLLGGNVEHFEHVEGRGDRRYALHRFPNEGRVRLLARDPEKAEIVFIYVDDR